MFPHHDDGNSQIEWLVDGMIAGRPSPCGQELMEQRKHISLRKCYRSRDRRQFLGRRCHAGPVLYLDYEILACGQRTARPHGRRSNRRLKSGDVARGPPRRLQRLLLTIAKETKPLIIVDPFLYAHGADENSPRKCPE